MKFPIKNVSELEEISSAARWQYFEKLAEFIFHENGFETRQNVVVKDGFGIKKQFDVIAKRYGVTYLVECKKLKGKHRTNVGSAVRKHLERCKLYEEIYPEKIAPIIVTLMDDSIEIVNDVPIIPITKLNNWINEL